MKVFNRIQGGLRGSPRGSAGGFVPVVNDIIVHQNTYTPNRAASTASVIGAQTTMKA